MYRIILVDDEPLILAGIASLIRWEAFDCTIIGKATNGTAAYDMIMKEQPDIVITDIRMPVLDGLELIEKCKAEGCTFAFLVLTNLEEFHLVKKALALGASDYLVKIELNEESLSSSLCRAKKNCDLLIGHQKHQQTGQLLKNGSNGLIRSHLSHLLASNTSKEGILLPEEIRIQYTRPFLILYSLRPENIMFCQAITPSCDILQSKQQIMDILDGIASRCFKAHTQLEYNHDTFILTASRISGEDFQTSVRGYCSKAITALKTYFELSAVFGVSSQVNDIYELPRALCEARTALDYYYYDSASPVVFYHGQKYHQSMAKTFNINFLKKELTASILQNDSGKLESIFNQIIDLFAECKPSKEQAASTCINLYTYLYSFFDNEGNSYQDIFPYTINIAQQLDLFNSLSDILAWLQSFSCKLCKLLTDRKETRSDHLVEQAKRYVQEHYQEKLALADLAEALNISPGHLSNTFKKYMGITLSDYIAKVKIEHAKDLIDTHQYLMYQISNMLGFDNPYYFSKVFKKITGISPRDHENRSS